MGHHAHTQPVVTGFEFQLIVELHRTGLGDLHPLKRKIEDNRFLDPLVDLPLSVGQGLRRPQLSRVEQVHDPTHSLRHGSLSEQRPVLPRLLDRLLQSFVRHFAFVMVFHAKLEIFMPIN